MGGSFGKREGTVRYSLGVDERDVCFFAVDFITSDL